jgi:hypothetical protein
MAAPSPATQKALSISPATADVNPNAVCNFSVDPVGTEVHWTIKPEIGSIDQDGVYLSPAKIAMPQCVIVTATTKSGQSALAAIDLTDAPARIFWLGWYGIAVGVLLAVGILAGWNYLYRPPSSPVVVVNPPLITLDPSKEEKFTFTANVLGDDKGAVTWSAEGGGEIDSGGAFRGNPDKAGNVDKIVKITAKSVSDPKRTGTAIVHLVSGRHLEISPQPTSVFPSQQLLFRTPNALAKWSVSRSDIASITPDGVFTAGSVGRSPAIVQVTAWGGTPHEQAAVAILVTPAYGSTDFSNWPLMLFVIMCGGLGSMVYYISSFVGYVGNRTFRSSWFWFYISRPFVGGALAVIFFFILGSGMINGANAGDLMKIGMISALVGLFSDKAVKKLNDILDVLLATKDDRKDKLMEQKPQAPATPALSGGMQPTIASITPASIPANTDASIIINGANFKAGFKVKVDGQDAPPMHATEQSFNLSIPAAAARPPKISVTVTTDQGRTSFDLPVK